MDVMAPVGARPWPVSRLFVAVWPPPALVARIREMDRPDQAGVRWMTEDQWHVTIRFLGDVPDSQLDTLSEGLARAAAATPTARASAGPRPKMLGTHVWVLPVAGLEEIAGSVVSATASVLPVTDARRYNGHITLARRRRGGSLKNLPSTDLAADWDVGDITLVRSDLHPQGARYSVIGRWPLRG
jgi:RNA 2',3'-cyclic 3'-phosphodiesterase